MNKLIKIGLDYRPATAALHSGITRQVLALEQALQNRPQTQLSLFTAAPWDHAHRDIAICPGFATATQAIHRPHHRLRFESLFLPGAIRDAKLDLYIATANSGLPLAPRPRHTRLALLLHDVFQLTLLPQQPLPSIKQRLYQAFDRFTIAHAVKLADQIWTPSQFSADQASQLFPQAAKKFRVLPNLVNGFQCVTTPPAALQLPSKYWLAVGTREPRKNIPLLLNAWSQARQHNTAVPDLILVGDRQDLPEAYRDPIPGLNILSQLSESDLAALYQFAAYLWQPSYAEGFGLPVIEALSVGTAVAVARGSALDEITPTDAPRFDAFDQNTLSSLMQQLATQPIAGSREQRQHWAAGFQMAAYQQRLLALIDELTPCH
jgi:glycosyltransferase involved in cell wall biosynthesis